MQGLATQNGLRINENQSHGILRHRERYGTIKLLLGRGQLTVLDAPDKSPVLLQSERTND